MECNWGLGGKNLPLYYPNPSPADHAIQVFPRSDLMNIPVNEAIQLEKMEIRHEINSLHRDIEKGQIRQEIHAAETARRRQLVVEVMREMAMEREIAKGMWTDRQSTYSSSSFGNHCSYQQSTYSPSSYGNQWFHQQSTYSPSSYGNQGFHQQLTMAKQTRAVVHSNISPTFPATAGSKMKPKDKLIVLDKPNQYRFGAQSTAVAPPADGSGRLIFIGKKPREEWSCALCRFSASNEKGFDEHLQGRKHKAKEAALRAETLARKGGSSKWVKKTCSKLDESKKLKKANEVGQTSKCTSESSDTTTGRDADAKASAITILSSDDPQGLETEDATAKKDATMDSLTFWRVKKEDQTDKEAKREDPTATISSSSDTFKESILQNAKLEEAKMENPTKENSVKLDLTTQEGKRENQVIEADIVENPLFEEATRDDSIVEKVRAEDPAVDEPIEDRNVTSEVEAGMATKEMKAKAEEIISERKKNF